MELPFIYALVSVLIVSSISLIGVFALSHKETLLRTWLFVFVSLAVGALFGDALLHLIPEAYAELGGTTAALWILGGILGFLILEKFLHWHHSHGCVDEPEECDREGHSAGRVRPLGMLVLVSDGLHNIIDGMIIAGSFLISIEVGIATTVAVILHEVPQEVSDFALLVHAGFSKMKALLVNFLSGLTAVFGALIVFALEHASESFVPVLTAIAAGAFIYIAGSDLVPELHKTTSTKRSLIQLIAIGVGIGIMIALLNFEAQGHEHEEEGHENDAIYPAYIEEFSTLNV